jgi:hypothetical protein
MTQLGASFFTLVSTWIATMKDLDVDRNVPIAILKQMFVATVGSQK